MNYLRCQNCSSSKCNECLKMTHQFLQVLEFRIHELKRLLVIFSNDFQYKLYLQQKLLTLEKRVIDILCH